MRRKVLLLAIVSMSWLWGWSQIDDDQARLLNLENAWNRSIQTKDTGALDMLLAPELVYVGIEGKLMSKAEYLASVRAPVDHPARVVSESMKVHVFGAAAIVDGVYRESGVRNGKRYTLRERFVDMWVRRGESWVCIASDGTLMEP